MNCTTTLQLLIELCNKHNIFCWFNVRSYFANELKDVLTVIIITWWNSFLSVNNILTKKKQLCIFGDLGLNTIC